jgi:hypothetical protein
MVLPLSGHPVMMSCEWQGLGWINTASTTDGQSLRMPAAALDAPHLHLTALWGRQPRHCGEHLLWGLLVMVGVFCEDRIDYID